MSTTKKNSVRYLTMLILCATSVSTPEGKSSFYSQQGKVSDWECSAGPDEDWQCKKDNDHQNKYSLESIVRLSLQTNTSEAAFNTHSNWQCVSSGNDQDWLCQTSTNDEYKQSLEKVTSDNHDSSVNSGADSTTHSVRAENDQTNALMLLRQEIKMLTEALAQIKEKKEDPADPSQMASKETVEAKVTADEEVAEDESVTHDNKQVDRVNETLLSLEKSITEKNSEKPFSVNKTLLELEQSVLQAKNSVAEQKAAVTENNASTTETPHQITPAKESINENMQESDNSPSLTRNLSAPPAKEKKLVVNITDTDTAKEHNSNQSSSSSVTELTEPSQPVRKISRTDSRNNIAQQLMAEQMNTEPPKAVPKTRSIKNNNWRSAQSKSNVYREPDFNYSNDGYQRNGQQHAIPASPYYQQTMHSNMAQYQMPERTYQQYQRMTQHPARQYFSEDWHDNLQQRNDLTTYNDQYTSRKSALNHHNIYRPSSPNTVYHTEKHYQQPRAISAKDIMRQMVTTTDEPSLFTDERQESQIDSDAIRHDRSGASQAYSADRMYLNTPSVQESSSDRLRMKVRAAAAYSQNKTSADYPSEMDEDQLPLAPDFSKIEEQETPLSENKMSVSATQKMESLSFQDAPPHYFTLQWASAADKTVLEQLKLRYPLLAQATIITSQTGGQEKYLLINDLFQNMHSALLSLKQEPWHHLAALLNPWARTMGSFGMFSVSEPLNKFSMHTLPQGTYTIQWATSPTVEYLNALKQAYPQLASAKIMRLSVRQQKQYLLIDGTYPDRLAALDAITVPRLKTVVQQLQPKARPAASLQNAELIHHSSPVSVASCDQQPASGKYTVQWIASGDPSMLSWVQQRYPALKNAAMVSENNRYLLIQGSFDDKTQANKMLYQPEFQEVIAALSPTIRPVSDIRLASRLSMF